MRINKETIECAIKETVTSEGKTYYYVAGSESGRTVQFDDVVVNWIRELLCLLEYIAQEREKRRVVFHPNQDYTSEIIDDWQHGFDQGVAPQDQFFGLAESVCDQLMYYFVLDELSTSDANHNLDFLCYHAIFGQTSMKSQVMNALTGDRDLSTLFDEYRQYLIRLVTQNFNGMHSAHYFDFFVGYWSGFESCVNHICRPYEEQIQKRCNESQYKRMKNLLSRIYADCKNLSSVMEIFESSKEQFLDKFPKYISFNDKRDYLFDEILIDRYKRDKKKDRDFLDFCAALRNTVHNNGTHLKNDRSVKVGDKFFSLKKMSKMYSEHYADIFVLAKELFDIYLAIYDGLDSLCLLMT